MTDADGARARNAELTGLGLDQPQAAAAKTSRDDYALLIGIDHYQHLEKLNGAINDANGFCEWLTRPDGGGVPADHVLMAPSKPDTVCPIKKQIDDALTVLIDAAQKHGGGRRLYFHFSGHGGGGHFIDDVVLLLAEWAQDSRSRGLSVDKYRKRLVGLHAFEEVVVLLDCCRRASRSVSGHAPELRLQPGPRSSTLFFVAYAAQAGAYAHETRRSGTWHGELTRCLLAILRTHGPISASTLRTVLMRTLQAQGKTPEVWSCLSLDSTFGSAATEPLPTLVIEFERAVGKVTIIGRENGEPRPISTWDVTAEPLRLPLPPGMYRIEDSRKNRRTVDHAPESVMTPHGEQLLTRVKF